MKQNKVCFFLHFDGRLNEGGSPEYVGGSKKGVKVDRNIKYDDLISVIHEKLEADPVNTVLSIKCRFVADSSSVVLYDVNDDDDLEVIMTMFDSKSCIAVSLYVTKQTTGSKLKRKAPSKPSKKANSGSAPPVRYCLLCCISSSLWPFFYILILIILVVVIIVICIETYLFPSLQLSSFNSCFSCMRCPIHVASLSNFIGFSCCRNGIFL